MPQSDNKGYHHFVWATWNREPLLTREVERHVYALIRQKCSFLKAELHALGGIADHVHLFVTLPMTITFSDFMKEVKGASARAVNNKYISPTWSFKWQGGYGYYTVCSSHASTVIRYIENQKQHHSDGTLWLSCEPPLKENIVQTTARPLICLCPFSCLRPRRRAECFFQSRISILGIRSFFSTSKGTYTPCQKPSFSFTPEDWTPPSPSP